MRYTKLLILVLSCLLLLAFAACGAKETNYIGEERALEIAIAKAASEEEVTEVKVTLTEKDGKVFYAVTFEDSTTFYEYDIDAVSEKLLRVKRNGKPTDEPFTIVIPLPMFSPEPTATTAE